MTKKQEGRDTTGCVYVEISGVVQGVGFRPFIYKLARKYGLYGFVLNDSSGVKIEVEGQPDRISLFLQEIRSNAPLASRIDLIRHNKIEPKGYRTFQICESSLNSVPRYVSVSADLAMCEECRRELLDPADRRYFYPFINCTNCGPRFTIIRDIPYDRSKTGMAKFKMCQQCQTEYEDPANRRFHAQPNACPKCGPRLSLVSTDGHTVQEEGDNQGMIEKCIYLLKQGKILAIKGLGGFHLACDACNENSVSLLRRRKGREEKPFAVMFKDIAQARNYVEISSFEGSVLESVEKPILLLRKCQEGVGFYGIEKDLAPISQQVGMDAGIDSETQEENDAVIPSIAGSVALSHPFLGVLLPYTPLHELLLTYFQGPLVMTSGNLSDEPIACDNQDALSRLGHLADFFLLHDRDIQIRCDDSVIQVFRKQSVFYRRSRGYSPGALVVPGMRRGILAVGAQAKNVFCLTRENEAILSHHMGDLENISAYISFEQGIEHFQTLFGVIPEVVVHDLHPEYQSTKWAQDRLNLPDWMRRERERDRIKGG